MIIKFVKMAEFTGYFVFFFDVEKVYATSMPDDDFYSRMGWKKEDFNKSYIEFLADSNELMFNLG